MGESNICDKRLFVFRNEAGDLMLFQREGNAVRYIVYPTEGIQTKPIQGVGLWSDWAFSFGIGIKDGDPDEITAEAISSFLMIQTPLNRNIVDIHQVKYPGAYYPRIMRKNIGFNYVSPDFLQDMRAYQNIQSSLDDLFNFIEPAEINLSTYGHKIRELLILACTEVEYLLLKVLTENGYLEKRRYSTNDYIHCRDVLKLNQYEANLTQYSNLGIFTPFKNWIESSPTASIPWYDAYNQVKHNRSDNIHHANLEHLLNAVAAIHLLLESQYSEGIFNKDTSHTDHKSLFRTIERPTWDLKDITAPILKDSYPVQIQWLESRKYFEDYPL